ncbi:probable nucleolar protein 5-2 [Phragmites australis]|uniref:probable nucleolar protein 5-2 n=1 Tax=Phragmites australis TaxID=29695 RepID=UPI002D793887|nr:probable nucleolar protein 5-2 [Phragmites australis]
MASLLEEETASESDAGSWNVGLGAKLGHGGEIFILVLFETPSGFAILVYDGVKLFLPGAIQDIWADFIKDYMTKQVSTPLFHSDDCYFFMLFGLKIFKLDKASAIKLDTGVDKKLASMIEKCIKPGQKLAVGKREYQDIIEKNLGISCLCNEAVMEVMWGLKNLMWYLVPDEKSELTKEDCLPMSEGMKIVLNRHGFDVKPDMVNKCIVEATGMVYECDFCVVKHSESLHGSGEHLKKISDIKFEDWDLLKLATALMMVCYPHGEVIVAGNPQKMISSDQLLHQYHIKDELCFKTHYLHKNHHKARTFTEIKKRWTVGSPRLVPRVMSSFSNSH